MNDKRPTLFVPPPPGSPPEDERAARLELSLNVAQELIVHLDAEGTVVYVNPRSRTLLGYEPEELMGRDWFTNVPEPVRDTVREAFGMLMRGEVENVAGYENAVLHRSGSLRTLAWRNTVLADAAGRIVGTVSAGVDVTEQRRLEAERAEREQQFRTIADYTYDWESWLDSPTSACWVNPAVQRMCGVSVEECLDMRPYPAALVEPEDRARLQAALDDSFERGSSVNDFTFRVRHRDGRLRWAAASWTPVFDEQDEQLGLRVSVRDFTERRLAQQRIAQQAQEILNVSVPVLQIWPGVLVAPLIGSLDSQRTSLFMERLLEGIVSSGARVAIIDITGVPTVDTQTAQHLIDAVNAGRLLGADIVLTGIRPSIAQTLVHLGIDLGEVRSTASLAAGLQLALKLIDVAIAS